MDDLHYKMFEGYEYKTVPHNGNNIVIIKDPECGFTAWIKEQPSVVIEADTEENVFKEIDISLECLNMFNATEGN